MQRQQQRPNNLKFEKPQHAARKDRRRHNKPDAARLPLLLAAGRKPLKPLCLEVEKALRSSAGLR